MNTYRIHWRPVFIGYTVGDGISMRRPRTALLDDKGGDGEQISGKAAPRHVTDAADYVAHGEEMTS